MKALALLAILFSPIAYSCELHGDVGKTTPSQHTQPIGVVGVGCRFDHKYDVTLHWIGEAELYDGALRDDGFPLLTVARVWEYKSRRLFGGTPELHWGLGIKGADRCAYNGEENCNRRMPLPFSFHSGAGLSWKDMRLLLFHDSNNALDHGPEKKNLGVTWLTLEYRFR